MAAHDREPSAADLARIAREEPLIAAELALVDAEIRVLTAERGPSALDWRRLRRAEQRVTRELVTLLAAERSAKTTRNTAPTNAMEVAA